MFCLHTSCALWSHYLCIYKAPWKTSWLFVFSFLTFTGRNNNHWSLDFILVFIFCAPVTNYALKCVVETHLIFLKDFLEKDVSSFFFAWPGKISETFEWVGLQLPVFLFFIGQPAHVWRIQSSPAAHQLNPSDNRLHCEAILQLKQHLFEGVCSCSFILLKGWLIATYLLFHVFCVSWDS